jgi:hypothetical protein
MTGNTVQVCLQGSLCVAPMAPFITGDITVPSTLTGQLISNVMYQWIRDLDDITGATSQTYALTSADVGHLIRVRMHFTDADNNFITVTSKPVGPIEGPSGAYVNAGAFSVNDGSSSSLTVQMPANIVPGNLLVVWMAANNTYTASPVTGWTFLNSEAVNGLVFAYRIADGNEGTSVNFGWSGALGVIGQTLQFSGVNTTTPLGVNNSNAGTGTVASNSGITIGSASSIVLALVLSSGTNQAIDAPPGWSEMSGTANNGASPFGYGIRAVNKLVAPGQPSGSLSVTIANAMWRVSLYEIVLA